MTDILSGTIALKTNRPTDGTAKLTWRCTVESRAPAYPEVQVRRLKSGAIDAKQGELRIEELAGGGSTTSTDGTVTRRLTGDPTHAGAFVRWEFLVLALPGTNEVELEMWARIDDAFERLAGTGPIGLGTAQLNQNGPVTIKLRQQAFPRLSSHLNIATPIAPPASYRGETAGSGVAANAVTGALNHVAALLYQVFWQLDAPGTLDAVWDAQEELTTSQMLSTEAFEAQPVAVAEELWARQVTEMLSCTVYSVPETWYPSGGVPGQDFIGFRLGAGETNPIYGLSYTCENLATFGVMSRGNVALGQRLNAGSGSALTTRNAGGLWYDHQDPPQSVEADGRPSALVQGGTVYSVEPLLRTVDDYGPGSTHLFANAPATPPNPAEYERLSAGLAAGDLSTNGSATYHVLRGSTLIEHGVFVRNGFVKRWTHRLADSASLADNQELAWPHRSLPHIGFVLRKGLRQSEKSTSARVQLLDTGGFSVSGRTSDLFEQIPQAGNYDGPPAERIHSAANPYRGTGVFPLPKDKAAAEVLRDHVTTVLREARPMGLVRLALTLPGTNFQPGNVLDLVRGPQSALVYISPMLLMWDDKPRHSYSILRYMWSLRALPGADQLQAIWLFYTPRGPLLGALNNAPRHRTLSQVIDAEFGAGTEPNAVLKASTRPMTACITLPDGRVQIPGRSRKGYAHPLTNLEGRQDWQREELPLARCHMPGNPTQDPAVVDTAMPRYFRWR